jgi:hypothetical protein
MVLASNSPKFLRVETFNITNYLVNQSPMETNFSKMLEDKITSIKFECQISIFFVTMCAFIS